MPETEVKLFQDDDGTVPFLDWLEEIEAQNRKIYEKCRSFVGRLAQFGHELRRPTADLLRDGVYELRFKYLRVNYRILYGFVGKDVVMVSHGLTKEKEVPSKEIDLAVERLGKFKSDPEKYTAEYEAD